MGGGPPPTPSAFFKNRNVFSEKKTNFPLSEAAKTQELLPYKKKKPHENDLGGLAKKMSSVIHFQPARHAERLQGVQMGAGCPLQPLRFFQRQTSRPQEANVESHVFSDRPFCSRSRGFHTRTKLPHENASGAFAEWVSGELKQSEVLGSRQPQL